MYHRPPWGPKIFSQVGLAVGLLRPEQRFRGNPTATASMWVLQASKYAATARPMYVFDGLRPGALAEAAGSLNAIQIYY